MKHLMTAVWFTGAALLVAAPQHARAQSDVAAARAELQSDRQAIVAANLSLTEDQAKAFWPVYKQYRGELSKLGDRTVQLITDYAKNQDTMTDAQASKMLDDFLAIQKDEAKIHAEWVGRFRKVLPPKLVTRYYQIENKLDTMARYEAADLIPLVKAEQK